MRSATNLTFSFPGAETAVGQAGVIKAVTALREMPPWPPGPKMLHDRSLGDAQLATLIDLHRPDNRLIVGYRITPGNGR